MRQYKSDGRPKAQYTVDDTNLFFTKMESGAGPRFDAYSRYDFEILPMLMILQLISFSG
jgi:hypothetical protein